MTDFLHFMFEQWFLFLLFFIILLLLFWNEIRHQLSGVKKLAPQQVVNMLNRDHAVIVDIRDSEHYQKGHILSAKNVPVDDIENKLQTKKFKDRPIILVCGSGQQGVKAGARLQKLGFQQVYSLQGGMQAWNEAGLPVAQGK